MNNKAFIKYTAPVIALILIVVTVFYYLYQAPKKEVAQVKKKAERATAINYQGGMVVGEVKSVEDIMAELEGEPPAGGGTFDLKTMAAEITASALNAFSDKNESALPLVAHWNVGIPEFDEAMNPLYMINRLAQGEHILVSWKLDPYYNNSINYSYYEESIKKAAEIGLPLVFVVPSPESALSKDSYYAEMDKRENPNVVTKDGEITSKLSPFGPDNNWNQVGSDWASSDILRQIQEWYPNPPLVIFVSEDKADKLQWWDIKNASRYDGSVDSKRSNFARELINNQWIKKYTQLHEGFKKGFVQKAWKSNVKFITKESFSEVGLDDKWLQTATKTDNYMNVWPLTADGMNIDFDLSGDKLDYKLNSPQALANNLEFMLKEAKTQNPNFAYQLSINDNGKLEDAARYRGLTQFALWFLKPSTIRQASQFTTRDELTPLFKEVVDSVELIHYNDQLADFWKNGTLVSNGKSDLNYQVLARYKDKERWFLLDTDANPKRPWKEDEQIAVWAFAVVKGEVPNREWLVYVQSPDGNITDVTVSVPGYKDVLMDAGVMGNFYITNESPQKANLTRIIKKDINLQIPTTWKILNNQIYGARKNNTGPIGGGNGYTHTILSGNFTVNTMAELKNAINNSTSGDIIFIPSYITIDFSNESKRLKIPAGVTLASDRGYQNSKGARLFTRHNTNEPMIGTYGPNGRITGLRIDGSQETVDTKAISLGIRISHAGWEIDNCEAYGFAHTAINVDNALGTGAETYIHHNYIHHNQKNGWGYGVMMGHVHALIEYNKFDYNRHAIAGGGTDSAGYTARNNFIGFCTNHAFDMHGSQKGGFGGQAGKRIVIENNFFDNANGGGAVTIRGIPTDFPAIIQKNIFADWNHEQDAVKSYSEIERSKQVNVNNNLVLQAGRNSYYISFNSNQKTRLYSCPNDITMNKISASTLNNPIQLTNIFNKVYDTTLQFSSNNQIESNLNGGITGKDSAKLLDCQLREGWIINDFLQLKITNIENGNYIVTTTGSIYAKDQKPELYSTSFVLDNQKKNITAYKNIQNTALWHKEVKNQTITLNIFPNNTNGNAYINGLNIIERDYILSSN